MAGVVMVGDIDALGDERDLFPDELVEIIETGNEYLDDDGELLDDALETTIDARSRAYSGLQSTLEEYDLIATPDDLYSLGAVGYS